MRLDLPLRYKGARNYLHGSDFVNSVDSVLEAKCEARLADITFRSFAKHQCVLWLDRLPVDARVVVSGSGRASSGGEVKFWIEESLRPVSERYSFDEDAIGAAATIVDNRIVLADQLPFTVIEIAIAITKVLAYAKSPDVDGKWVFGQLKLSRPLPREYREIAVVQKSIVANRLSNNAISVDGEPLGDMRFIVGAP